MVNILNVVGHVAYIIATQLLKVAIENNVMSVALFQ